MFLLQVTILVTFFTERWRRHLLFSQVPLNENLINRIVYFLFEYFVIKFKGHY